MNQSTFASWCNSHRAKGRPSPILMGMTQARASSWIPFALAFLAPIARAKASPVASPQATLAANACAACHGEFAAAGHHRAPNLSLSVRHLEDEYLVAFLSAPHSTQPGTRMPDMLGGLPAKERAQRAKELAAFLRSYAENRTSAQNPEANTAGDNPPSPERGDALFHRIGCVMCHGPRRSVDGAEDDPRPVLVGGRDLGHVGDKYNAEGLAAFLLQPLDHRPAGLMPDMQLSRGEARDLAAYLVPGPGPSKGAGAASGPAPSPDLVAAGAAGFRSFGCANCHTGIAEGPKLELQGVQDLSHGCLSASPPRGVPNYAFIEDDRNALRVEIALLEGDLAPAQEIARSLAAFRCTACHTRGGTGGVPPELDDFLTTTEPDLGDSARRPPSLTGVGGKLRSTWMERVLLDGASVRPYMGTRMPIFGAANVGHLPAHFAEVDQQPELTFPKPKGDQKREIHDAARELLGTGSLGCVTCHAFNAKPAPTFQGIDLVTSPDRLQERWFRDFLIAPQKLMPGVVMPESWPGGVALHDTMLGGDTDRQIGAIWDYLTLGRSARDPKGIHQPRWDVDVADRPRVYRGRSRVAGFRGIAVGFPEGVHYAFDANNGALAAIWRGDFVSVNWNGQGAGDFNPRSRAIELTRDVAMLARDTDDAPWPLRPTMTKERPINPDPTYPRQHGYQFRGYHLGKDGTPTLRYALGNIGIDDRIAPDTEGATTHLRRLISFRTPAATRITFRALVGGIEELGTGRFRAGNLVIHAGGGSPRLRGAPGNQELLLDLDLPAGGTQLELTYEINH